MSEKPEKPEKLIRRPGQSRFALAAIGLILLAAFFLICSVMDYSGFNIERMFRILFSVFLATGLWIVACILILVAVIRSWLKKCRWAVVIVALTVCILFPLISAGYYYWPTSNMLVEAAAEGNASAVRWCITNGVDVNKPMQIRLGFNPASSQQFVAETPLTMAIKQQHFDIVKLLVQNGADVNRPDGLSLTPLGNAILTANPKMVQLLLDLGANPSINPSPINLWVRQQLEPEIKTPETEAIKVKVVQIQEILAHAKASSTSQP